jgi:hypothetical protein
MTSDDALTDDVAASSGLAEVVCTWVDSLEETRLTVFEQRIAQVRSTRNALARDLGLSAPRLKGIEHRLTRELSELLAASADRVGRLRAQLEAACPVLQPWEALAVAVPELAQPIPGTKADLTDLCWHAFPDLHLDGHWVAWQPPAELRHQTIEVAEYSLPAGFRARRLAALQRRWSLEDGQWDDWLRYCGLRRFRGTAVPLDAGLPVLAEALVAAAGRPLTNAEIAAGIGVRTWKVRDAVLGTDSRFCQVGPGTYGLAEWESLPSALSARLAAVHAERARATRLALPSTASPFGPASTSSRPIRVARPSAPARLTSGQHEESSPCRSTGAASPAPASTARISPACCSAAAGASRTSTRIRAQASPAELIAAASATVQTPASAPMPAWPRMAVSSCQPGSLMLTEAKPGRRSGGRPAQAATCSRRAARSWPVIHAAVVTPTGSPGLAALIAATASPTSPARSDSRPSPPRGCTWKASAPAAAQAAAAAASCAAVTGSPG